MVGIPGANACRYAPTLATVRTRRPRIVPSFFAYYQLGLAQFLPFQFTASILASLGGLIVMCGTLLGPETRGKAL